MMMAGQKVTKAYWVRIGIAGKQYHRQQGRDADSEQGQPGPEHSAYSRSLGHRRLAELILS
jgi:hypothetical protein